MNQSTQRVCWIVPFVVGFWLAGCGGIPVTDGRGNTSETPNRVSGKILVSDGRPSFGDTVEIRPALIFDDTLAAATFSTVSTNPGGHWVVDDVPRGLWRVRMSNGGHATSSRLIRMDARGRSGASRTDTLQLAVRVTGRALHRGMPLGGALVGLAGTPLRTQADVLGQFELAAPRGDAVLVIRYGPEPSGPRLRVPLLLTHGPIHALGDLEVPAALDENAIGMPQIHRWTVDLSPATGVGVSGDHIGFPVLVDLDLLMDREVCAGHDLRWSNKDGLLLNWQVDRLDYSLASARVWVRLDTAHGSSSEHHLQLHCGDSSADDRSNGALVFSRSDGWLGVWHLGDHQGREATGDPDLEAGIHGTRISGNPSGSYLAPAPGIAFEAEVPGLGSDSVTVSFWVLPTRITDTTLLAVFEGPTGPNPEIELFVAPDSSVILRSFQRILSTPHGVLVPGRWSNVAFTLERSDRLVGLQAGLTRVSRGSADLAAPVTGTGRLRLHGDALAGLDEVRIAAHHRSRSWLELENMVAEGDTRLLR